MSSPMLSTNGFMYVPASPATPTPIRPYDVGGDLSVARERSKNWVFTCNNYTVVQELDVQLLSRDNSVAYLVYGREVGESGTPHLQGYVQFKSRRDFNVVKALLPSGIHIERVRGSPFQAAEYCKKDGDYFEFVNLV